MDTTLDFIVTSLLYGLSSSAAMTQDPRALPPEHVFQALSPPSQCYVVYPSVSLLILHLFKN